MARLSMIPTRRCLECGKRISSRLGLCRDCRDELEAFEEAEGCNQDFEPEDEPDPRRYMPRNSNL